MALGQVDLAALPDGDQVGKGPADVCCYSHVTTLPYAAERRSYGSIIRYLSARGKGYLTLYRRKFTAFFWRGGGDGDGKRRPFGAPARQARARGRAARFSAPRAAPRPTDNTRR
ncbi:hypothetical protein CE91St45_34300 [Oscillospiraceae bacterium]|nr:hypothetical protein CE91St45_34300 [Oscillospiraceae bacterium]